MVTFDPRDPNDVSDFKLDWTDVLDGDTIAADPVVTITPVTDPPLVLDTQAGGTTHTTTTTTAWLSGGKPKTDYTVSMRVTTAGGRTLERSAVVPTQDI